MSYQQQQQPPPLSTSGPLTNGLSQQNHQQQPQQQQQQQQQQQYQQQYGNLNQAYKLQPQFAQINKFLPPMSQNLPQQTQATTQLAHTTPQTSTGNSPYSPTTVVHTTSQQPPASQYPNQPAPKQISSAAPLQTQQINYLTNGGSSHSSRTASPALNTSQNQSIGSFAQQVQSPRPPQHGQGQQKSAPVQNLAGSLQNLTLNQQSVPIPASQSIQNITSSQANNYSANFQTNFKPFTANSQPSSSQLNSGAQQVAVTNQLPIIPQGNSIVPPVRTNGQTFTNANTTPARNAPILATTTTQQQPVPTQPIMQSLVGNALTQPILSAQKVTFSPAVQNYTQSTVNNNFTQQQSVPPSARKPMYPTQQAVGYSQPTLQQGYKPTFNGQPNTGPLQYQPQQQQPNNYNNQMSATHQGFNKLWGQETVDLMQHRHILPQDRPQPPPVKLNHQIYEAVNCSPDIFRCTVTKIPESNSLLQKTRLPLGILIHPFRDLNNLPVIQCATIVRCRLCRTYINPFVYFVDTKKWKCNLCYRINELPEEFQYDPVSKSYGDVTRRPEVKSSTIEFIAPSEYMLRPPQPAIYLFLLDVSILAQQSGYLEVVCNSLAENLDNLPGDARTRVGVVAYNSAVHFYNIADGYNQPHEVTVVEIDDVFLPSPDNLLINLNECKELLKDLLTQLPTRFANSHDSGSALGAALQAAYKLMSASGGRVTVFQACLPNKGPGALLSREDPNNRSAREVLHLGPATDFYKRQALECSGQQIAVDLFLVNQQYSDLATLSGVSKYSGGCVHHFPLYQKTKAHLVESFKRCLERYLTRKVGFEAVMRVRCTRGLQIHTFHGNFFVRSTDLLSLPNVNPDAGYGMQISYEESLTDVKTICFQAALLYTSSKGERRIRVHTLCMPVSNNLIEIMHSADSQCIIGLLSKMAVDRSLSSTIADARDAFINATVDILSAFKTIQNLPSGQAGQLLVPQTLSLLPLYILALLKHPAFRTGTSTRLDDRVWAMDAMKTLPLDQLIKYIYPEFYVLDVLFQNITSNNEGNDNSRQDPPLLQLTAEYIDSRSMFLIDSGSLIIIYVGLNVPSNILQNVFGVATTAEIPDYCYELPTLNTTENETLTAFIDNLNEDKPYLPTIQIIRDTSPARLQFIEKLVDDRSEASLSYYEFLQHLRSQVK